MISPRTIAALCLLTTILISGFAPSALFAADNTFPTFVQGMVGVAQFSEDDLTFAEASTVRGTTSDNDLSQMPYVGLAFQRPFLGDAITQLGLDGGILFGWRAKNTRAVAGNGQIAVSIYSSLLLVDLSVGLFVKHSINERWRLYAATGPAVVFGDYSDDTDEEILATAAVTTSSNSFSEFGAGFYGRAGFDYQFRPNAYIGVCVRGIKTSLEFDAAPGASSGLSGAQGFLTFSRDF